MSDLRLSVLKWLGTSFTILGALLTSLQGYDPYNVWSFNLGATLWLWASILMRESALIAVNATLICIYVVGIVTRM